MHLISIEKEKSVRMELFYLKENRINHEVYNKQKEEQAVLNQVGEVLYLTFPVLSKIDFIKHGFSTRLGGVSTGDFKSMNLSFQRGDNPELVKENYHRICDALQLCTSDLVFSDQIHETKIYKASAKDKSIELEQKVLKGIDGLITDELDVVLVTSYADCVPLFFVDPVNRAIGLSHSGWKGTVGKIGKKTVEAMKAEYHSNPNDILAVIAPSICRDCYEVSEDVYQEFQQQFTTKVIEQIFEKKENGKYQLDLWLANKQILLEAGLLEEQIYISEVCTCCNCDILYSHRATNGKRGNLSAFLSISLS